MVGGQGLFHVNYTSHASHVTLVLNVLGHPWACDSGVAARLLREGVEKHRIEMMVEMGGEKCTGQT
jgi:hypothetical protein